MQWITPARDAALRLIDPIRRLDATAATFGFVRERDLLHAALDEENLISRVAAVAKLLGYETDSDRLYDAVASGASATFDATAQPRLSDDPDPGTEAPPTGTALPSHSQMLAKHSSPSPSTLNPEGEGSVAGSGSPSDYACLGIVMAKTKAAIGLKCNRTHRGRAGWASRIRSFGG